MESTNRDMKKMADQRGAGTRICICGGGSLAHVCAGVLSSRPELKVNILTRRPEQWSHQLQVTDPNGQVYAGQLDVISNDAEEALQDRDIIFLCLPGYAIESTLQSIKPYVGDAIVGSIVCSTGFFFVAHRVLGQEARLFGFQRVPYIARTTQYGHAANLLGYKPQLAMAVENVADREAFRLLVESIWATPVKLLGSHYEVSLTNSNPILHTGRLYTLWSDWDGKPFDHNVLFYREWTDQASQILIDMDAEFMQLLQVLPVRPGAIPTLLDYYESHDAASLTRKLSSIAAFQNIAAPMMQVDGGWIPDYDNRYFAEDFPYGLAIIRRLAHEHNIACPTIDKVYAWGMTKVKA